jgi:GMP synthase-like glutamine amidotransferase
MISLAKEPRRGAEPKPILALYNRYDHSREHAALVQASRRAHVQRSIVDASILLDDERSWKAKTSELGQYAGIWAGGSGDMDHTHSTPGLTLFYRRMEPLVAQAEEEALSILAECFSQQGILKMKGAKLVRDETRWEGGTVPLHLTEAGRSHSLFNGVSDDESSKKISILSLHKDSVAQLPQDLIAQAKVLATSDGNPAFPESEGNPYAVVQIGNLILFQQHTLYKPENIEPVFEATNNRIKERGELEPFPQTHPFHPIDDCERITVNFLDGLTVEKDIFTAV